MNTDVAKTNLLGLSQDELEQTFAALGEKPFRARQLMQWMYQRGVTDFDEMTDLSKSLREKTRRRQPKITLPEVLSQHDSTTARSNGCSAAVPGRPSRPSSSRSRGAARCAFPRRSAARSIARSARPARRASTATSMRRDYRPGVARDSCPPRPER